MSSVYFNNKKLPAPKREYVAFIDIMGTQLRMNKSVKECATYIFKLHSAIISSWREKAYKNVFVYPVMDGAYITASRQDDMQNILTRIYRALYDEMKTEDINYIYPVRGAIAYGEVIHGHTVPYTASKAFEMNLGYKDNILLGRAMIDAYQNESNAAPFGIYLHDSAIKRDETDNKKGYGVFSSDWKWFNNKDLKVEDSVANNVCEILDNYFDLMMNPKHPLHYSNEKIERHRELLYAYFARG